MNVYKQIRQVVMQRKETLQHVAKELSLTVAKSYLAHIQAENSDTMRYHLQNIPNYDDLLERVRATGHDEVDLLTATIKHMRAQGLRCHYEFDRDTGTQPLLHITGTEFSN